MTELITLVGRLAVELFEAGRLVAKAWDMTDDEISEAVRDIRRRYADDVSEYERIKRTGE